MKNLKFSTKALLILAAVLLICIVPLLAVDAEFGGADGEAEEMITAIEPAYEPWFTPLMEPPAETESMLFALQAAIGAGFIGYAAGRLRGRAKSRSHDQTN
ncbi:energy-coupling factor ABC transporter substrate-binding protein [Paenibacillus tarimensis]|uniref:energy-coupling factor ABC transporter substrate-binding protein n=1 Tax=Paenibacillus tarimensis TaxID=416012 RepID=UPI001F1C1BC3|nr:energy-coupling factor ABC transporter substrate-binding protein [Paenibacillus tarimensis]MCF2944683.1 energy-coupling factor ABC transporter substrate-binding protein [Paenibacillus tarimensis]